MKKLLQGVRDFQQSVFDTRRSLFEKLAKGQQPLALFITCSDSRIDPNLLTQTEPGELFILRNAGNIVPPHGAVYGGEDATIEYALSVLQVNDIVICGHSQCGAMSGLLNPDSLETLPGVKSWLKHSESVRHIIDQREPKIDDPQERLNAAVQINVLTQLDNLRTHPAVAAALDRDAVKLHGWVYRFETGQVLSYVPGERQFLPLDEAHARESIAD